MTVVKPMTVKVKQLEKTLANKIDDLIWDEEWGALDKVISEGISIDSRLRNSTIFGRVFEAYLERCRFLSFDDKRLFKFVHEHLDSFNDVNFVLGSDQTFFGGLLYSEIAETRVESQFQKHSDSLTDISSIYQGVLLPLFRHCYDANRKRWGLQLIHSFLKKKVTYDDLGKLIVDHFIPGQQPTGWSWDQELIDGELHLGNSGKTFMADVELVLEHGANLDATAEDGHTALMRASMQEMPEAVEFLLSKGASVNLQQDQGNTALMYVSGFLPDTSPMNEEWIERPAHLEIAKILVKAGADISIENQRGDTAIDLARRNKNSAVLAYLESQT